MSEAQDAIRVELERLQRRNKGLLSPEVVVEAASKPDSPLHAHFDWNDTEAARKWRLAQARQLIQVVVKYTYAPESGKVYKVRAFTSLPSDRAKGNGYRHIDVVLEQPDMRVQMLRAAKDEMERFVAKYAMLSELAEVFAAIERVMERQPAAMV